jgi:predicted enzyme related to lactoylglutathione lyase
MAGHDAGIPSWVDLASADVEASKAFYGGLFGWTSDDAPEPEAGGYTTFYLGDKAVAGVGPVQMDSQPPVWTTYVSTDDADETAARVEKAGGRVLMTPMDVMEYGRMAIFTDPAGAAFAIWQAGSHPGGEVFSVPGAPTWHELATRDIEGSKVFYGEVFDWAAEESQVGPNKYITWKLGGRSVGGMIAMVGDAWPADLPPHWMVYFAVADCDESVALARTLGASVSVPPTDIPVGRFAVLTDPQGAFFSVITMTEPMT